MKTHTKLRVAFGPKTVSRLKLTIFLVCFYLFPPPFSIFKMADLNSPDNQEQDVTEQNQDLDDDESIAEKNDDPGLKRKREEISDEKALPYYQQHVVRKKRAEGFSWLSYEKNAQLEYHCSICMQTFSPKLIQTSRLRCHEATKKHMSAKENQDIALMFRGGSSRQTFNEDFIAMILSNNVPPCRIESLYPSSFISALLSRRETTILSSSSYRTRYAEPSYERWLGRLVAEHIGCTSFSLLTDESSKNNRKVINTIAMTNVGESLLIDTKVCEGDESVDAIYVCNYLTLLMERFSFDPSNLVGITRDNASYMKKAVTLLKEKPGYKHVLSVSCLSHGLNLVSKAFLEPFHSIKNELFTAMKKMFSKPSARRTRASASLPGFVDAVQVSQTRWSGWLDAIAFVYENSSEIMVNSHK